MVNLRSIPLASNSQSCLGFQTGFIERETNIFLDILVDNIFFWVLEEKKELSPSQEQYNKLEKYLSVSIYKNIY